MKQIMCPFFREPCLRENCTAFIPEVKAGTVVNVYDHSYMDYKGSPDRCTVLGVDLPEERG